MQDGLSLYEEVNRRFKELYSSEEMSPFAEFMVKQTILNELKVAMLTKQMENLEEAFKMYKERAESKEKGGN